MSRWQTEIDLDNAAVAECEEGHISLVMDTEEPLELVHLHAPHEKLIALCEDMVKRLREVTP